MHGSKLHLGIAVGAFLALPGAAFAQQAPAKQVTFAKDVSPIFQSKCQSCHEPGSIAPMSLVTYQDARPWARAIKDKVVARQMPPWFADPAVGAFANDPRLSAEDIATISRWVDAGAPQGDPKDMPAPPRFTEGWQLGEPDMVIELPEATFRRRGPTSFQRQA